MTAKELIKELETCEPDAVVSIVINEINLEVTELITPAPENSRVIITIKKEILWQKYL